MGMYVFCSAGMGSSQMMWSWLRSRHLKSGCSGTRAELDTSVSSGVCRTWGGPGFCVRFAVICQVLCECNATDEGWGSSLSFLLFQSTYGSKSQLQNVQVCREKKMGTFTKTQASLFFLQTDWLSLVSVPGKRHKSYLAIFLQGKNKSKNLEFS